MKNVPSVMLYIYEKALWNIIYILKKYYDLQ